MISPVCRVGRKAEIEPGRKKTGLRMPVAIETVGLEQTVFHGTRARPWLEGV